MCHIMVDYLHDVEYSSSSNNILQPHQIIAHPRRIIEVRLNTAQTPSYLHHNNTITMRATLENINRKTDNRFLYALGLFCLLNICISEFPEPTKSIDNPKTELIASNLKAN